MVEPIVKVRVPAGRINTLMNDLNRIRRLAGLSESDLEFAAPRPTQNRDATLEFIAQRVHEFFPGDRNGANALNSIAKSLASNPQVSTKLLMHAVVALIRRYHSGKVGQADVMRIVMRIGAGGQIDPAALKTLLAPPAQKSTGGI